MESEKIPLEKGNLPECNGAIPMGSQHVSKCLFIIFSAQVCGLSLIRASYYFSTSYLFSLSQTQTEIFLDLEYGSGFHYLSLLLLYSSSSPFSSVIFLRSSSVSFILFSVPIIFQLHTLYSLPLFSSYLPPPLSAVLSCFTFRIERNIWCFNFHHSVSLVNSQSLSFSFPQPIMGFPVLLLTAESASAHWSKEIVFITQIFPPLPPFSTICSSLLALLSLCLIPLHLSLRKI